MKPPVAAGLPVVGSMFRLQADFMGTFLWAQRNYGDVVHLVAGPPKMRFDLYCVFSAAGVQQILNDPATYRKDNKVYVELRESIGNGLLTSQDETYVRQRRLLQPLFSARTVDTYASLMVEEVASGIRGWDDAVDVHDTFSRVYQRVIGRALFGDTDVAPMIDVVQRTLPDLNAYTLRRGFEPISTPRHWRTPANRRAAAAQQALFTVSDEVIRRRQDASGSASTSRSTDLLSLLARARDEHGRPLSVEEIREQVLIFMLTGQEVTATAMSFALHLLAKHPEIQEKCRAEAIAQIGGRQPLASDVIRLPLLTRVLKEAMRLFPPNPWTGRSVETDTVVDGYHIPAGGYILMSQWVTHRNPTYWPDPERFDPDRFLAERETTRPRYSYLAFGGGHRGCIGQYFAMLQLVLGLALVLCSYRLEAIDDDIRLDYGITLIPKGPMRCRVTPMRG